MAVVDCVSRLGRQVWGRSCSAPADQVKCSSASMKCLLVVTRTEGKGRRAAPRRAIGAVVPQPGMAPEVPAKEH